MAPRYPRTVSGLLAALAEIDEPAAAAAEVDEKIAHRFNPPRPMFAPNSSKQDRMLAAAGFGRQYRPAGWRRPSERAIRTAELANQVATELRQFPQLIVALTAISKGAARPVDTAPLYVRDGLDDHGWFLGRDIGTGTVTDHATRPEAAVFVPWWPQLPPAADQVGYSELLELPPELLEVHLSWPVPIPGGGLQQVMSPTRDLIEYAQTLTLVRGRDTAWHEFARNMRGGGHHAEPRRRTRAIARNYRDCVAFLAQFGDRLAADVAVYLETIWSALEVLTAEEGVSMPTLSTSTAAITSLATRIRDQITAGHGGRLTVADDEIAFSWAPGPAVTLLSFLATGTVTGRRATVVVAEDGATKVGKVAEGAAKPTGVVVFTSEEVDLQKYAGQAELTTESAMFTRNIEVAMASVLQGQIVRAIESDAAAAMTAAAGVTITAAADITAGVLAAIAQLRGNGANPTVVGLAADDWLELMTAQGGTGGYLNMGSAVDGPQQLWMGCQTVIVPGLAAGSALVADGRSVSVVEPAGGPLALVDPFSKANVNRIVVTVEEFAVATVTSPGGVASVTVTATP